MDQLTGSLHDRSLFEVIGRVRAGWRTGTLTVRTGAQTRRFNFVDGDLYLPAGHHVLGRQVGELLAAEQRWLAEAPATVDGGAAEPPHRALLRQLVSRIAELIGQLREGEYSFQEGQPLDSGELVGPLWSTLLVVEGADPPVPSDGLAAELGGEDAIAFARADPETARRLGSLRPEIGELLARIETPATLGDLARRGGSGVLELVYRMREAGLVAVLLPGPERATEAAAGAGATQTSPLTERLSSRIAESLGRDPPDEEPATHRGQVAELLSRLGSLDHYEVLGITPLADEQQVHAAFERLGRLVHPVNAARLNWIGREGVLRLLFERATAAYTVLSDPARRTEYNRETGIRLGAARTPEQRKKEVDDLAEQLFQRASQHAGQEDYFLALELLKQAIAHRPRAEYFGLLGSIQRRNPKWLREAQDSFRRAIELAPGDTELRIELARLQERAGEIEAAKQSYRAVLDRKEGDTGAAAALRRLERYAATGRVQGGWLRSVFGWLRRERRARDDAGRR